jgi:hypothetical protein
MNMVFFNVFGESDGVASIRTPLKPPGGGRVPSIVDRLSDDHASFL